MLYTHSGLWADFLLSIVLLIPLSVSFLISFLLPDIQVCFSTLDDAGEKIISPVASCTWVLTQCTSIPLWDRLLSFDGSAWCIVVLGKKSSISKVLPTVSSTSKLIFFPSSSMLEFLLRRAGLPQVSFIHGYLSGSTLASFFPAHGQRGWGMFAAPLVLQLISRSVFLLLNTKVDKTLLEFLGIW